MNATATKGASVMPKEGSFSCWGDCGCKAATVGPVYYEAQGFYIESVCCVLFNKVEAIINTALV